MTKATSPRNASKITFLLLISVLGACIVSCGEAAGDEAPVIISESADETTEEVPGSAAILGDYNFEGAVFTIIRREYAKLGDLPSYEFTTDSESGDLINDTVYRRNIIVEEQYNTVIESVLPS